MIKNTRPGIVIIVNQDNHEYPHVSDLKKLSSSLLLARIIMTFSDLPMPTYNGYSTQK